MFGWITGLFGSSKTADSVVETAAKGIYNGIDMLFYTDEEKSQGLLEARKLFLKFTEKAYDQNSIRSVTRRWLSFLVMGPTILCFTLSMIGYLGEFAFADKMSQLFGQMIPWAGGILAFYFGPHLIGSMRSK